MKTVRTIEVVSELDDLQFGYWRPIGDDGGEFVPIQSVEDFENAAAGLGCSVELLDMVSLLHDSLISTIKADLVSIWQRLDLLSDNA